MSWSGGTFTRVGGSTTWGDDRDASVEIEAGLHDTHDEDLATGINNCLAKDGQNAATADLDIGSNKLTNVGAGTTANDAVNKGQLDGVSVTPTGAVVMWTSSTLPAAGGWLFCDGSAVSRTTYASLYAVIGDNYGHGDGSTTFNLPDMRGKFPRGWDNGAGNDPDAGTRTAQATGGATGDAVGSIQGEDVGPHNHGGVTASDAASHTHTLPWNGFQFGGGAGTENSTLSTGDSNGASATTGATTPLHTHAIPTESGETRPLNVSFAFIIKT